MKANHPFVVWAACLLWMLSLFAIVWSIILFFCVGDMLIQTGTDVINSFMLLSGVVMLPTNIVMLYSIANGIHIHHNAKVVCCPLWLCIICIIFINMCGAAICLHKIRGCEITTDNTIKRSMIQYRSNPKYKYFMDTIQWSLNCCGLQSYKDWYDVEWYDKIRNYEWDPPAQKQQTESKPPLHADSVPQSCCKSGSCISNFLSELGTHSINTRGCVYPTYTVVMFSVSVHLFIFVIIMLIEILVLRFIVKEGKKLSSWSSSSLSCDKKYATYNIMPVKENFNASSCSYELNAEGSADEALNELQEETDEN